MPKETEEEMEQRLAKETCMCGDYMNAHTEGHGHTPVSMYDYYKASADDEFDA